MADNNRTAKKILNSINAITSAVDMYHDDKGNYSIYLSDLMRLNIMNFMVDLFNNTKGKGWLIEKISEYIVQHLPYIENTMKVLVLGYVESMLSCSVKPIITEQMILDGVYFDLQSIDLFNILSNEPVITSSDDYENTLKENKPGKYLYFGCGPEFGIYTIPDLVKCRDFNAFMWYTKNTPGVRNVWKREIDIDREPIIRNFSLSDNGIEIHKVKHKKTFNGNEIEIVKICKKVIENENEEPAFYTLQGELVKPGENGFGIIETTTLNIGFAKQGKRNGIVTLEYNAKSSGLTDAEHNQMYVSEPLQNCLHVFIGCCSEILSNDKLKLKQALSESNGRINEFNVLEDDVTKINNELSEVIKEYKESNTEIEVNKISACEVAKQKLNRFINEINNNSYDNITDIAKTIFNGDGKHIKIEELNGRKVNSFTIPNSLLKTNRCKIEDEIKEYNEKLIKSEDGVYPSATSNYYYLHPLIEFNTDLIFSMKWFDEKVVAAQLINAITGCLEFNSGNINANGLLSFNISHQNKLLQYELEDLIERVIENDDDIVSDCFFTFDNDKFNAMMQASEMNRMGLFTIDGKNPINPVSPSEVMSAINALSANASKEELTTAIEHSILTAVSTQNNGIVSSSSDDIKLNGMFGLNLNTNINVFEVLIKKLVYIIVSTFLMPKIYLIIMFNMKLMEQNGTSFDISQYIEYCKSMFVDIIKKLKEMVIEYFKNLIMDILNDLLNSFKPLMLKEQYMYYKELIASCIECLKINGYDWAQDMVDYADIDTITSVEEEC